MASNDSTSQQLLEAFIPGYSLITTFFSILHIDITKYVAGVAIIVGVIAAVRYAYSTLGDSIISYFISTAEISPEDEMYNFLMSWLATQPFARNSRQFVASASTNSSNIWDPRYSRENEDEDDEDGARDPSVFDESDPRFWRAINTKEKMAPLYFTPGLGTSFFRYKGRILSLNRQEADSNKLFQTTQRSAVFISCFGRDPQILKDLLDEARNQFFSKDETRTVIYRGGKPHGYPQWTRCMSRNARPLSTVVIDEDQKNALLDDMKDYLHPATRRFYANRGIPYRRGYLLHGPPGTGKSSLSFALAGIFGLQLYIVNLNSKIDEDDLARLFEDLPRQCLVLLEDIDTAGVEKRPELATGHADETDNKPKTDRELLEAAAKGLQQPQEDTSASRVTLSALLNIIDGVAAQEGRILVMTTNHLNKLDEALIRPGRVDMMVGFSNADQPTVASLFRGMFAPMANERLPQTSEKQSLEVPRIEAPALGITNILTPPATPRSDRSSSPGRNYHAFGESEIAELSERFAEAVPAKEFSPAEIQGYLLQHKRNPARAVAECVAWVDKTRSDKRKRDGEIPKEDGEKEEKVDDETKAKDEERQSPKVSDVYRHLYKWKAFGHSK